MSPRGPWLSFERHGGLPPRDDESLELAEDGTFTARLTIGGPGIGAFEGSLSAARITRVRKAVAALDGPKEVEVSTPDHGATEVLAVAGRTLRTGSNETPPKPWRPLLRAVRGIVDEEAVEHPRAAIRLIADAKAARLEHAGHDPIDVDLGSLEVRVVLRGGNDDTRDRWQAAAPKGQGWVTATQGWTFALPFDHGLRVGRGDWLQVRVELAIREAGRRRAGLLYVPVIPDA